MSVFELINEIDNNELVLPAIQRDFVWDEERVETLLDSLFRGYPVGIALLWETYQPVQIRPFVKDHEKGQVHLFDENKSGRRIKLVLDGQQRLSSLYVALRGSYNKKRLFFDALSGRDSDNSADVKYIFSFLTDRDSKRRNENQINLAKSGKVASEYWIRLADVIGKHPKDAMIFKNNIVEILQLSDDDKLRLDLNIQNAVYSLTENNEILKTQTIDNKLPADDQRRKTASDVLEIFVRVNTQGMTLRRSDLIVSMMRLYWQDASTLLPHFLEEINKNQNLQIDNDFVIRCMFSTAGIGTRLDFELLRKKSNVVKLEAGHAACFDAIRSALDFARDDCSIDSARLLGGLGTLVPIVHYLYSAPGRVFNKKNQSDARKALYLFALSKIFSQYAESRTGAYVRDYLPTAEEITNGAFFRLDWAVEFVNYKAGFETVDARLFSANIDLSLSLLQRKTGGKAYYDSNKPELDHIFPKSVLFERGADAQEVNSIGNLWILPQGRNRNKSAKHPHDFLEGVDDETLTAACIDRELLDYRSFRNFIKKRQAAISDLLIAVTGLSPTIFDTLSSQDGALGDA